MTQSPPEAREGNCDNRLFVHDTGDIRALAAIAMAMPAGGTANACTGMTDISALSLVRIVGGTETDG
ncbi:MAG TPA: hypothetical protein VKN63_12015 [Afifellaceae bacterium]|nr:hypothetical protein [Afifellaceae bacterium]